MSTEKNNTKNVFLLTPLIGSISFVIIYVIATLLYPGGSQANKDSIGFSWMHNYWCNLLNETAINGQPNPARPIAIVGMLVLCISLTIFWVLFSLQSGIPIKLKYLIRISGILSMIIAFFLFSGFDHDLITNLASLFGLIATMGVFTVLYQKRWKSLFYFGCLNIFLVGLNNYVYYTEGMLLYLPVLQKISFASFLIWICLINIQVHKSYRQAN